ncbi:DUF1934 domain-containing protein [Paenibacillus tarimensis]
MKRKVRIALESRQEDEVTEHEYIGEWVNKNKSVYLQYEEDSEGEAERTRTTVRWNGEELKIMRRGTVQTEQTFALGKRRSGEYGTRDVRFAMETVTHSLTFSGERGSSAEQASGGEEAAFRLPVTVDWSYTLWMDHQHIGRFQIRLRIQEVEA